jgi:PqqD family protein of HPr-rel-A system
MAYRAEPATTLAIVPLDSLTAIYHRRSGQTHLVAEPVPEILAALGGDARDLPEILTALDITDSAEARAALTARLDELIATGLVLTA